MPIAFFVALGVGALAFAATWPGFDPQRVAVRGNHRVATAEILARAAVAPRESIWLQNTRAMERRIAAIPYVAAATVHRMPPASVTIVVSERSPFAELRSGDSGAIVDRSLRVLTLGAPASTLPVLAIKPGLDLEPGAFVHSRDAGTLRAAYDAMSAHQIVPTELAFDRFGGIVATLPDGPRLLLGSERDLDKKLTLARAILSQVVTHRRPVAAIDLRAPATPVLVYR
jgi:cell division septal protein FtsQ